MTEQLIRVLVVDDHPIVRNGLVLMVQYKPEMEIVAEAANGIEAVALFRQYHPDVTLMDLQMPEMSGVAAITAIRQEHPEARIIVLSTYDSDEEIYQGLQAGAKGYILKNAAVDEIVRAIHVVHSGKKYIPPEVGEKLAERMSRPQLSQREQQVLELIAQGKNNSEIAEALHLSESAIKYHANHVFTKLGVGDRTQAALLAIKRGMVKVR